MRISKLFDPLNAKRSFYIRAFKEANPWGWLSILITLGLGAYTIIGMHTIDDQSGFGYFIILMSFLFFCKSAHFTLSLYTPVLLNETPMHSIEGLSESLRQDIAWLNNQVNASICMLRVVHMDSIFAKLNVFRENILASFAVDKKSNIRSGFVVIPLEKTKVTCPLTLALSEHMPLEVAIEFVLAHELGHIVEFLGQPSKVAYDSELESEVFADLWALMSIHNKLDSSIILKELEYYRSSSFSGEDHATYAQIKRIFDLPEFEFIRPQWSELNTLERKHLLHKLMKITETVSA